MKATITNNGTLIISPENSIEYYALVNWYENYMPDGVVENPSTLRIDLTDTGSDLNL